MYCRRLLDLPSTSEKNEAKAMLRELNQLKASFQSRSSNSSHNSSTGRRRSSRLGRTNNNNKRSNNDDRAV